jgi:hypothetical protein
MSLALTIYRRCKMERIKILSPINNIIFLDEETCEECGEQATTVFTDEDGNEMAVCEACSHDLLYGGLPEDLYDLE